MIQKSIIGRSIIQLTIILFLFISYTLSASAQKTLGIYEFTGDPQQGTQSHDVTLQPSYATFSPFSRTLLASALGPDYYNTRGWQLDFNSNAYLEFTITAKNGHALQLTQISLNLRRSTKGPKNIQIAHNASGNFTSDFFNVLADSTLPAKNVTWDFKDIKTSVGKAVTFRIYGWNADAGTGTLRVDNVTLSGRSIPNILLNELHYYNSITNNNAFVELLAPKDYIDLDDVTVSLYNSNGQVFATEKLSNFKTLPDGATATDNFYFWDISPGISNDPGGISISIPDSVLQFLSYGAIITATNGPATGKSSENIGITETSTDGTKNSLYLAPTSSHTENGSQSWFKYTRNVNTKGYINDHFTALPVDLIYFKSKITDQGVELAWKTGMEKDNKYFEIESSEDALLFRAIGQVNGLGTSADGAMYTYLDRNPGELTYYRLKQIDIDGTFSYSAVVTANRALSRSAFKLYPNPTTNYVQVAFANTGNSLLHVYDLQGRLLLSQQLIQNNTAKIDVSSFEAGNYILLVIQNNQKWSQQFRKV